MSKISKELKDFKEILIKDEIEYLDENYIEEYDLHFLIDSLNNGLMFITDTRDYSYIIHSLEEIIIITILALFANCNNFVEVHLFAKRHYNWLKKQLGLYEGLPSLSTFKRVISIIEPSELEPLCNQVFMKFVSDSKEYNILDKKNLLVTDIYALDGKTCNSSERQTRDGMIKKTNAMSAYSIKYEKTLATEFIDEKTNEIPTGTKLLKKLNIKDTVITFDALNTHKEIIDYIVGKDAHYVAPIKENNRNYYNDIKLYFSDKEFLQKAKHYKNSEKSHNQIETREYYFTNDINWLSGKEKWAKLKSIGMVKRITEKCTYIKYFISDIDMEEVEFIANVIRNEWSIENKLHWYLDTVFKEDNNKCYLKNSQKNLNIIRKFCLGILKQVKQNYKISLNSIRFLLSMDFENELEKLLKML